MSPLSSLSAVKRRRCLRRGWSYSCLSGLSLRANSITQQPTRLLLSTIIMQQPPVVAPSFIRMLGPALVPLLWYRWSFLKSLALVFSMCLQRWMHCCVTEQTRWVVLVRSVCMWESSIAPTSVSQQLAAPLTKSRSTLTMQSGCCHLHRAWAHT